MDANFLGRVSNYGELDISFEFDVNSSGVVQAVRGGNAFTAQQNTDITVSLGTAGTYTAILKVSDGTRIWETLSRSANVSNALVASNVTVTSIAQGAQAPSSSFTYLEDITMTIVTTPNGSVTPTTVATACTLSVWAAVRIQRISNPF